jgi:hypothetical protein
MTKKKRKTKMRKKWAGKIRKAAFETLHSAIASRNAQKQTAKTKTKREECKERKLEETFMDIDIKELKAKTSSTKRALFSPACTARRASLPSVVCSVRVLAYSIPSTHTGASTTSSSGTAAITGAGAANDWRAAATDCRGGEIACV